MAKENRKCNNISKVLDVDKKTNMRNINVRSVLQIQSCHDKENSWRCVYGGTQLESCFDLRHKY